MSESSFVRRVALASAVVAGVVAACALLARHPEIPLLAFGGVLGAVFVDALARPLARLGLPRWASVASVALAFAGAAAAAALLLGPQLLEQGAALVESLPSAWASIRQQAIGREVASAVSEVSEGAADLDWQSLAPVVFGSLAGVFSTAAGALTGALALLALSVFIAIQPETYLGGALRLAPAPRRARLREVADAIANALRWWLVGRATAMALVAVLTVAGLALLGVSMALALGLVAGVLTFVPYVGPIAAAVPAILVALADSPALALQVVVLYTGVQLVENYLITPLVQGRAVSLPPALLIVAQILLGVLLGVLGLSLATPLLVAVVVAVQALYVQDVLGEPVTLLGERAPEKDGRTRRAPHPAGA